MTQYNEMSKVERREAFKKAVKHVKPKVEAGAAHLDNADPEWWRKIDPAGLSLRQGSACILGQLGNAASEALLGRSLTGPNGWDLLTIANDDEDEHAQCIRTALNFADGLGLAEAAEKGFTVTGTEEVEVGVLDGFIWAALDELWQKQVARRRVQALHEYAVDHALV